LFLARDCTVEDEDRPYTRIVGNGIVAH